MRQIVLLVVLVAVAACAAPPAPEVTALQAQVVELEGSLAELQARFPATAQLAPGLAEPDGTCQYAANCGAFDCCTWSGGSCWCDTCCYAVQNEFLAAVEGEGECR